MSKIAKHITESVQVHDGPAVLRTLGLSKHGSVAGSLEVYDGLDDQGTLLAVVDAPSDPTYCLPYICALQDVPITIGIYIKAVDSAAGFSATVVYEGISDE